MAIRTILRDGDPVLKKRCHPVTRFDRRLGDLLDDMKETLGQAHGLGLAAPQVGILRRAVVVVTDLDSNEMLELVNPEILDAEGEETGWEGCLSVPGLWGLVTRPAWVRVRAQDRNGDWFEAEGEGVTARCFCHELAHLDGHLYTELCDRLYTPEEVDRMEAEAEAAEAAEAEAAAQAAAEPETEGAARPDGQAEEDGQP